MIRTAILAASPWSETSVAVSVQLAKIGCPPVGAISLPTWHWKTLLRKSVQWGWYDFGKYAVRKMLSRNRETAVRRSPLLPLLIDQGRVQRSLYETARLYGFPLCVTRDINAPRCADRVRGWAVDVLIYTGGGVLRRPLIEAPRLGVLNAHAALLPEVRGMSGPEWSLLLGIPLGVTVMFMDTGIDTGPILLRRELPLFQMPASVAALQNVIAAFEVSLLAETVGGLDRGILTAVPQQNHQDRQYFVVHEALASIAQRRLLDCRQLRERSYAPAAVLAESH